MFDTRMIGKKIASLRKAKNMTQAELADAMEISYQAVSNWERGNSMPDISKLPQLSLLLGCSMDDILGESKETELMEKIIEGNQAEFVEQLQGEEQNEVEVITNVAPFIKPRQTQELVEVVIHTRRNRKGEDGQEGGEQKESQKTTLKELIGLAPFLSEEYLNQLAEQADVSEGVKDMIGLAPFLSEKALGKLTDRICLEGSLKDLIGLAPFLSKDTLDTLVGRFLEDGNDASGGQEETKILIGLAPFLSQKTIQKIAEHFLKTKGAKGLKGIAPFL